MNSGMRLIPWHPLSVFRMEQTGAPGDSGHGPSPPLSSPPLFPTPSLSSLLFPSQSFLPPQYLWASRTPLWPPLVMWWVTRPPPQHCDPRYVLLSQVCVVLGMKPKVNTVNWASSAALSRHFFHRFQEVSVSALRTVNAFSVCMNSSGKFSLTPLAETAVARSAHWILFWSFPGNSGGALISFWTVPTHFVFTDSFIQLAPPPFLQCEMFQTILSFYKKCIW